MGCVVVCFGILFCFMGHPIIGVLVILLGATLSE